MNDVTKSDPLIVSIDQGTSSTKAVVVNGSGQVVARATVPLGQTHPQPGYVEQDPRELLESVTSAIRLAVSDCVGTIVAMGISSQRESAIIWDRATAEPLGPVLGWQDRRTADAAQRMCAEGHDEMVRARTGLPIDPMFSALKFGWLLDSVDPDRRRSTAGDIALGTVDSWILYALSGEHRIERGNASRTQLLNINTGEWDDELLDLFRIPAQALPRVTRSNEPSTPITGVSGVDGVPVAAVLADSHAALYGHGVREPGAVKVTYGTGSSVMGLLGAVVEPQAGLVRTIAWDTGTPALAFEGNILSAGATVAWMANLLSTTPDQLGAMAERVEHAHGISLVPAFAGLGAPWWDPEATGILAGLTLGTSTLDLARAAFDSVVLQVEDVLSAADAGAPGDARISTILADGGPSANGWLMQLQADMSQRDVVTSEVADLSAVGAAYLAGSTVGLWSDAESVTFSRSAETTRPRLDPAVAVQRRSEWNKAVGRARGIDVRSPSPTRSSDGKSQR